MFHHIHVYTEHASLVREMISMTKPRKLCYSKIWRYTVLYITSFPTARCLVPESGDTVSHSQIHSPPFRRPEGPGVYDIAAVVSSSAAALPLDSADL